MTNTMSKNDFLFYLDFTKIEMFPWSSAITLQYHQNTL